jgi:hypothetical protein
MVLFTAIGACLLISAGCVGWFSNGEPVIIDDGGDTPLIQATNLPLSLHADAGGMQYWYEQPKGLGSLVNLTYEEMGCGHCHVSSPSCDSCHADAAGTGVVAQPDACLACHGRLQKQAALGLTDLHSTELGFVCSDCHSSDDIHGDGNEYDSVHSEGAVDAACKDCHTELPNSTEHTMHGESFNCEVCHVSTVITCYNCHIQTLIDAHEKKPAAAFQNFEILINDANGKIRSASYQSSYYGVDDVGHVAFGPFHGHNVTRDAKHCADCHDNDRIKELNDTGEIVMTWWDEAEGKVKHTTGVIPFVPDRFRFQFVDLIDGAWHPVDPATVGFQYEFCTPLTADQLAALGVD